MFNFFNLSDDRVVYRDVSFFNFHNHYLSEFQTEIAKLITGSTLIITSVDGGIDEHLKKFLENQKLHFDFSKNVCLLYPESLTGFFDIILTTPEVAFYCCKTKPPEAALNNITQGYVEEFGKISKKIQMLKAISEEMELLKAFLYISQGSCNLFLALKEATD
ncbi:MAG: hypothetical protein AB1422_07000 [bacterium]